MPERVSTDDGDAALLTEDERRVLALLRTSAALTPIARELGLPRDQVVAVTKSVDAKLGVTPV